MDGEGSNSSSTPMSEGAKPWYGRRHFSWKNYEKKKSKQAFNTI